MTDIGLNYTQPSDASYPDSSYYFEIIKEGIDLGTALITDSFITFGRVPDNTIELEHPYRIGEAFLYDISTHGTFLNKKRVPTRVYIQIAIGDMIHFGNSTRKFIYSCKTPKRITPHQSMQWNQKEEAPVHKLTFLDPKATLKKWCLDNDYSYTLSYQNIERGDNILITCVCEVSFSFANGEDLIGKGEGEKKGIAEKEACLMVCKVLDERGFLADYYEMKDAALKRLKELDGVDDDDEDMYDLTKKVNISVPIEVHGAASHKLAIEIRIEELKGLIDGVEGNVWVDSMEEFDELDAYMANNKDSLKREQLVVWKKELTLKELSMVTIQNEIMLQEQMEDEKRTLNKSRIMEESAMKEKRMNELERIVKLEKEKQIKSKEDLEREKTKEKEVHEQKLADSISELNKSTVESNQKKRRTQGPMTSQVYDKQMKYDDQDLIDCVFEKNVNKSEIQKQKSAYGY